MLENDLDEKKAPLKKVLRLFPYNKSNIGKKGTKRLMPIVFVSVYIFIG